MLLILFINPLDGTCKNLLMDGAAAALFASP